MAGARRSHVRAGASAAAGRGPRAAVGAPAGGWLCRDAALGLGAGAGACARSEGASVGGLRS